MVRAMVWCDDESCSGFRESVGHEFSMAW